MLITGGNTGTLGTALLIAAAPVGKGRLVDASSVLPALAAVPPSALTGTRVATVIELADPLDPQTVLTRVRAVAATDGPLFLYIAGQLQLDRKQRLPHLALARSAPSTLRYTGLPWHWLAAELTGRPRGTTTVIVDLVADTDAWARLADTGVDLGPGVRLYGRVAPSARREQAVPTYLGAYASVWRGGSRPDLATLHEQAAIQAGMEGALLLAHVPSADGAEPAGDGPRPVGSAPGQVASAPAATREGAGAPPARRDIPTVALPIAAVPAPKAQGTRAQGTANGSGAPAAPAGATAFGTVSAAPRAGGVPPLPRTAAASVPHDPHPAILAAARAGRHGEAAAAAAAWEQQELRTHGPHSLQAIHWLEVRADLARLAQRPGLSCELWMTVADARLARQQAADESDVEGAVDRAHHQWEQIEDPARARELAPRLVALRRAVPGRQRGALRVLQRRLEKLQSGSTA
ncbi:hypothetical protein ABZ348_24435 [Streptomyces sp. NPDC005963]|uniref:hypothetical protein n=1 Tax=Streptomyces sp. NPDC005963 TaxID=3156721 RepID=UPI0033D46695